MAQRIHRFNISVAAETTGQVDALTFPAGEVTAFVIQIPHGHHHLTGLQIAYGDVAVVPDTVGAYVRGNGHTERFELDDPFPGGSGWYAQSFNNDHHYTHVFHCGVEVESVQTALLQLPPVILLPFSSAESVPLTAPAVTVSGGRVLVE